MQWESAKRAAAAKALIEVQDGMRLGLGTGSTSKHLVELLAQRVKEEGLRVQCCATSRATADLGASLGLSITDLDSLGPLDLTIDGADEIAPGLALIKGGGAAHLREKIVAAAAKRFVVIADSSKCVDKLGSTRALPLEVLPFAWKTVCRAVESLGARTEQRVLNGVEVFSDNGNRVVDAWFPPMDRPDLLAHALDKIPGLLEHGLFIAMAQVAYVAQENGGVVTVHP